MKTYTNPSLNRKLKVCLMVKSDKDKIKNSFFHFIDLINENDHLKSELRQALINQAVVHSVAIESNMVNPIFLFNRHEPEELRYLERHFPDYYNLMIETNSLREAYTNLEKIIAKKRRPDFEWLLGAHKEIFRRTHYNIAGKLRTNKSIEPLNGHSLPHHSIIPEQLEQHFDWLHERLAQHRKITRGNLFEHIYISAEMHFRIIASMPFEYGNGIMARLLTDYILLSRDIFFPVVEFSSKRKYIQALKNTKVDSYRELTDYFIDMFGKNLLRIEGFIELSNIQSDNLDETSAENYISTNSN
jgi:fido (protein-threonine AMPylation protein)